MGIKDKIKTVGRPLKDMWLGVVDPRRIPERYGQRVVFNHLQRQGFLDGLKGGRILEIGPKHGEDSRLLATLSPAELVLVDLPEKDTMVREWLPQVSSMCKTTYLERNILYLTTGEYEGLGTFDLIFCLGVLYHNVEQVRLLRRLYDLCSMEGRLVIESATTRNRKLAELNVVEIHWPRTYRNVGTITHLPSRLCIKSWLEMVGFSDVRIWNIYSRTVRWQRAVLTGIKKPDSKPYVSYSESGLNPVYVAGEAQ